MLFFQDVKADGAFYNYAAEMKMRHYRVISYYILSMDHQMPFPSDL